MSLENHHTYPNTNQEVIVAMIVIGGGAGVGGTNVRSHVVSLHTTSVQRKDKLSPATDCPGQ